MKGDQDDPGTWLSSSPGPSLLLASCLLVGSAIYAPGMLYASWLGEMSRGYRLGLFAAVVLLGLVLLSGLMTRLNIPLTGAMCAVAITWMILSIGGSLAHPIPVDWRMSASVVTVIAMIAGVVVYRLRGSRVVQTLLVVLSIILLGTPSIEMALAHAASGRPTLGTFPAVVSGEDDFERSLETDAQEVWFIVLDAYPSSWALREVYGAETESLGIHLIDEGFIVNENSLTPYAFTHLALPAIFENAYHAKARDVISRGDMTRLSRSISGYNRFFHALASFGFEVSVVENGWRLSGCLYPVDRCVPAPLLDEPMGMLIEQSVFGPLLGIARANAFSRGLQANIDWLAHNIGERSTGQPPQAVYLHLVAPHPPFVLASDCSRQSASARASSGLMVAWSDIEESLLFERRALFVEQTKCVTELMLDLVASARPDVIIGIVGDHGPDSLGQFDTPARDWTEEMILERMLTLAAVRLPESCPADLTMTFGVVAGILDCLGDDTSGPPIPPRAFLSQFDTSHSDSIIGVDAPTLERLLGHGVTFVKDET